MVYGLGFRVWGFIPSDSACARERARVERVRERESARVCVCVRVYV